MGVLGETLQQARQARGLSLERAAQETRVPFHYLRALEQETFASLPAPIFARGFLRIYARYLGLDSTQLVLLYPASEKMEPEMEPLPEPPRLVGWRPLNWFLGGGALLLLFLVILAIYSRGGSESPALSDMAPPAARTGATSGAEANPAPGGTGGLIAPVPPGTLPDFRSANISIAYRILAELGVNYVVVKIPSSSVPAGIIYDQSPAPGSPIEPTTTVTLLVSQGGG